MEKFDKAIMEHKVKLGNEEFTIGEMLLIEQESINDAFMTQAGRLAYLGMVLAKAEVAYEEAKEAKATLTSDLDLEVRAEFDIKKLKDPKFKPTEAMVTANVQQFEEYQEASSKVLDALHNYKIMKGVVDAMRQRGDMLVSLGAQLRQEYDVTGLSILKADLAERGKQRAST